MLSIVLLNMVINKIITNLNSIHENLGNKIFKILYNLEKNAESMDFPWELLLILEFLLVKKEKA